MNRKLVLFLLLFPLASFGQKVRSFEPYAINLSVENGLPSNEVYDMHQDDFGRFWFCTDNGLSVFDGQNFRRVTDTSYSVIMLGGRQDPKGNLWFFTLDSEILLLEKGSDEPKLVFSSEQIRKYFRDHIISYLRFIEGKLVITTGVELLFISDYESSDPGFEYLDASRSYITCFCDGADCIAVSRLKKEGSMDLVLIENNDTSTYDNLPLFDKSGKYWLSSTKLGNELILHGSNNLLRLNLLDSTYSVLNDLPQSTLNINIDDESIWIGSYNDGMRVFSNDDQLMLTKHLFKGRSFSKYVRDKNGSLWLCSQESGIYYLPFPNVRSYNMDIDEGVNISEMKSIDDACYIGQYGGAVSIVYKNEQDLIFESLGKLNGQVRKILKDSATGEVFIIYLLEYLRVKKEKTNYSSRLDLLENEKSWLRYKLTNVTKGKLVLRPKLFDSKALVIDLNGQRINRIRKAFSMDDHVFFGGFYNSYGVDTTQKQLKELKINGKSTDLRAAVRLKEDTFLIGTKGAGLALVKGTQFISKVSIDDSRLNTINDMVVLRNSVWIACPDALFEYNIQTKELRDWTQLFLKEWMSFQEIEVIGNQLLVATHNRYYAFDPALVQWSQIGPEIYAVQIEDLQGKRTDIRDVFEVHESEASFRVIPRSVSFVNLFKHQFRYRLLENDTNWILSESNVIPFNALNPGSYHLELSAGDGLGNWSTKTEIVELSVNPFFYKSFWFYGIIIILLVLFGTLFYR